MKGTNMHSETGLIFVVITTVAGHSEAIDRSLYRNAGAALDHASNPGHGYRCQLYLVTDDGQKCEDDEHVSGEYHSYE